MLILEASPLSPQTKAAVLKLFFSDDELITFQRLIAEGDDERTWKEIEVMVAEWPAGYIADMVGFWLASIIHAFGSDEQLAQKKLVALLGRSAFMFDLVPPSRRLRPKKERGPSAEIIGWGDALLQRVSDGQAWVNHYDIFVKLPTIQGIVYAKFAGYQQLPK